MITTSGTLKVLYGTILTLTILQCVQLHAQQKWAAVRQINQEPVDIVEKPLHLDDIKMEKFEEKSTLEGFNSVGRNKRSTAEEDTENEMGNDDWPVKQKRAADRFYGTRGKKRPLPSDGFVGMRGKKDNYDDGDEDEDLVGISYWKRPSVDAFYGMRGKKDENYYYYDDDVEKRNPKDGFLGMRGKKLQITDALMGIHGDNSYYDTNEEENKVNHSDRRLRPWPVEDQKLTNDLIGSRAKKSDKRNARVTNFLQNWANQMRRRRMTTHEDQRRRSHVDNMFIGMRG